MFENPSRPFFSFVIINNHPIFVFIQSCGFDIIDAFRRSNIFFFDGRED